MDFNVCASKGERKKNNLSTLTPFLQLLPTTEITARQEKYAEKQGAALHLTEEH